MEILNIKIGEKIEYLGKEAIIIKIVDLNRVSIQELKSNIVHTVGVSEIRNVNKDNNSFESDYISALTDKEWETANFRYNIIKPLLKKQKNSLDVKEVAEIEGIHFTTLYRWLKMYKSTGTITSLISTKPKGGKGRSRLTSEVDQIITEKISTIYLNSSKKSITKVIRDITIDCKDRGLDIPHPNTIRNRISSISEEELIRSRYGKSKARDKFEPIKSHFPGANFPLSVVQIDHTKLDIILVDEHYRKPFRRPWLTLAMDVFSRTVVGFYISFDPPGEMGTGLCIANSILPKELWLEKYSIKGDWPCWGLMKTIHVDNAKEFRGKMLSKSCLNYGIDLEFRPVATPHWGGHVERLLGTFSKEIHNLAGSTFSNIEDRENYNSEKKASLSIKEFEKWLLIYIVKVYHQKKHSIIGMSPLQKYQEGILGNSTNKGIGIPSIILDERRLRLDFMPFVERTIQEYGVVIDHITYYDEVLRKYIHAKDGKSKFSSKRKFIFKRDPRDISEVYFLDPELNEYYQVPYRDTSKPPISIWEYRDVIRELKKQKVFIDEDSIFNSYKMMDDIELEAIRTTKTMRRTIRHSDTRTSRKKAKDFTNQNLEINNESNSVSNIPDIKPFEDLDDEAFT